MAPISAAVRPCLLHLVAQRPGEKRPHPAGERADHRPQAQSQGDQTPVSTNSTHLYPREGALSVVRLGPCCNWLDTGTHDSLLKVGIEKRTGMKIAAVVAKGEEVRVATTRVGRG